MTAVVPALPWFQIRQAHASHFSLAPVAESSGYVNTSCLAVPDDEDGVRDALRGMLRSIGALQDLGHSDGEWESIVPEDVVPDLADPQARARHGAAKVDLAVVQHVRFDAARVLMTGCEKIGDDGVAEEEGGVDVECSVCFDALLRGEAVELPGCEHAFHRRCIFEWFRQKPTW
ncbi:unnamed protein product [Miscanthus lutarioriparius]|uniref:RING-type domain-containing protein n=1 Tax=Miscanthus lutarioriparius TaxID=422564 RepID=A0A811P388_9POAL|nr:unnamed protein product [Miscanthus lutarioriparius]